MKPISYEIKENIIYFRYNKKELRNFLFLGYLHGDVGGYLVKREGNFLTYKCFGTIERPSRVPSFITINHFPAFDGRMLTDNERITPIEHKPEPGSYKFIILDLSKK